MWFKSKTPKITAEGRDRAPFRDIGTQAAILFMRNQDLQGAAGLLEHWSSQVGLQFGEFHPDIGRALLLSSTFLVILGRDAQAVQPLETSIAILQPLGATDFDLRAAKDLHTKATGRIAGTWTAAKGIMLASGTPIGDYFMELRPQ